MAKTKTSSNPMFNTWTKKDEERLEEVAKDLVFGGVKEKLLAKPMGKKEAGVIYYALVLDVEGLCPSCAEKLKASHDDPESEVWYFKERMPDPTTVRDLLKHFKGKHLEKDEEEVITTFIVEHCIPPQLEEKHEVDLESLEIDLDA